eukprot:m.334421 g.334421  ORF g.334421 m.334421 type:complete len:439 (-) comp20505_c1_seq4:91-1407(-)
MPFTGIIEEIGNVKSVTRNAALELWDGSTGEGLVIEIGCSTAVQGAYIGCSIAVNGTCLTVTKFDDSNFTVHCAPETIRLTNLGELKPGDKVNLERAQAADARNSGHCVQGHIDGMGTVVAQRPDGEALWVTIAVPSELLRYIVKKGYVAVDGTSLTVTTVDHERHRFSVMLIAHTQKCITLPHKIAGRNVNIEVDVLAKYVEASVGLRLAALEKAVFGDTTEASSIATSAAVSANTADETGGSKKRKATENEDSEMVEVTRQIESKNLHGKGLQVPLPSKETASAFKIGIVSTCWHSELIDSMEAKCIEALVDGGVAKANILRAKVSGSFELPFACEKMMETENPDAVIAIGILLKGGTIHMEVIAYSVTKALLEVQSKRDTPVVFGVLTVMNMNQAKERAESDLGWSWGQAALAQAAMGASGVKDRVHLYQTAESM